MRLPLRLADVTAAIGQNRSSADTVPLPQTLEADRGFFTLGRLQTNRDRLTRPGPIQCSWAMADIDSRKWGSAQSHWRCGAPVAVLASPLSFSLRGKAMPETKPERPDGSFADCMERSAPSFAASADKGPAPRDAPSADGVSSASQPWQGVNRLQLFRDSRPVGYLGQDAGQWCVIVPKIEDAVRLECYLDKGRFNETTQYFRNADDPKRYLSVSQFYRYVGFYNWLGAVSWRANENQLWLTAEDNNGLSVWAPGDDANSVHAFGAIGYTELTVGWIPS